MQMAPHGHSSNSQNTFMGEHKQNLPVESNLSSNFNQQVKPKMDDEPRQHHPLMQDDPHFQIMSEIRHSPIEASSKEQYSSNIE